MSEQQTTNAQTTADYPPSTLVGAKRVRTGEKDTKGRDRTVLTFGPDSRGVNGAVALANAITELTNEGKQFNLDIRIGEATHKASGRTFPNAFVVVKEMIPKSQSEAAYTPKPSRADTLKADADKIRAEVEG